MNWSSKGKWSHVSDISNASDWQRDQLEGCCRRASEPCIKATNNGKNNKNQKERFGKDGTCKLFKVESYEVVPKWDVHRPIDGSYQ